MKGIIKRAIRLSRTTFSSVLRKLSNDAYILQDGGTITFFCLQKTFQ